jgi:hypothetical protein
MEAYGSSATLYSPSSFLTACVIAARHEGTNCDTMKVRRADLDVLSSHSDFSAASAAEYSSFAPFPETMRQGRCSIVNTLLTEQVSQRESPVLHR